MKIVIFNITGLLHTNELKRSGFIGYMLLNNDNKISEIFNGANVQLCF